MRHQPSFQKQSILLFSSRAPALKTVLLKLRHASIISAVALALNSVFSLVGFGNNCSLFKEIKFWAFKLNFPYLPDHLVRKSPLIIIPGQHFAQISIHHACHFRIYNRSV